MFLAKNSAFHSKLKHVQTKYHFIRYLVEDKLVILEKICGSKNPTDMLTKGVTIEKLKLCATSVGLLKDRRMSYRDERLCFGGLWLMLVIELVSKWEICWALWSLVLFDLV